MRGRKPTPLLLQVKDKKSLQQIAWSQSVPWYQVRHARIVLAMAEGQRVQAVATQMQCAPRTVRRTCQIYQAQGLRGLFKPIHRSGHPNELSPPATGANCPTGVLGSHG